MYIQDVMTYNLKDKNSEAFDNLSRKEKIIFLAGVFDGEGSFGCYLAGSPAYKKHYLHVSVEATDSDLVARFNEVFPVGAVNLRRKKRENYHKPAYIWRINGEKAWPVLEEMVPYMCKRRRDKFYDLVKSYRHGSKDSGRIIQKQESNRDSVIRS